MDSRLRGNDRWGDGNDRGRRAGMTPVKQGVNLLLAKSVVNKGK